MQRSVVAVLGFGATVEVATLADTAGHRRPAGTQSQDRRSLWALWQVTWVVIPAQQSRRDHRSKGEVHHDRTGFLAHHPPPLLGALPTSSDCHHHAPVSGAIGLTRRVPPDDRRAARPHDRRTFLVVSPLDR